MRAIVCALVILAMMAFAIGLTLFHAGQDQARLNPELSAMEGTPSPFRPSIPADAYDVQDHGGSWVSFSLNTEGWTSMRCVYYQPLNHARAGSLSCTKWE